jgi:predicted alpha/beta-fold hydrolase
LTHILKQYYENRYLVDALEQTTSEFLATMNAMSEFDESLIRDTHGLLEKADFIKFAKASSDELESGKALNLAIDIVNRTKIQNNQGEDT